MLLSLNKKIMFLAVPKTGSRSVLSLLRPNSIILKEDLVFKDHLTYTECCESAENRDLSDFDRSKIETVYLFYRDPVERFISAVNYIRTIKNTTNTHLLRKRANWFSGVDYSWYINANGVKPMPDTMLAEINNIASSISPEQIFADQEIMQENFFRPQHQWHNDVPQEKISVLDFANFEENLRMIGNDFGVPSDVAIPKLNESTKITTSLSPELEAAVKEYYAEDYALKP